MECAKDAELLGLNTFGIAARCGELVVCHDVEEVRSALSAVGGRELLVLGGGSNVLFLSDFSGVVLRPEIRGVEVLEEDAERYLVRVGAGELFDRVVSLSVDGGLVGRPVYGLENLSGIPGTMGAAPVQNIGAYGAEVGDCVAAVEGVAVANGSPFRLPAPLCLFGYRSSIFKVSLRGRCVITHVVLRLVKRPVWRLDYGHLRDALPPEAELTAAAVREAVLRMRGAKLPDPSEQGSAGSFFKNPEVTLGVAEALLQRYPTMPHYPSSGGLVKIPAAWLIEQSGWKGRSLGRAAVHDRQPLVLVNLGGATGAEVWTLAQAVIADVERLFGIRLSPEVNVL